MIHVVKKLNWTHNSYTPIAFDNNIAIIKKKEKMITQHLKLSR